MKVVSQSIKPFQQGYNAGILGKSTHSCPYEFNSKEAKQWLTGHKRGNDLVWFLSVTHDKAGGKKHA
jgi:ribosome modulation factor